MKELNKYGLESKINDEKNVTTFLVIPYRYMNNSKNVKPLIIGKFQVVLLPI